VLSWLSVKTMNYCLTIANSIQSPAWKGSKKSGGHGGHHRASRWCLWGRQSGAGSPESCPWSWNLDARRLHRITELCYPPEFQHHTALHLCLILNDLKAVGAYCSTTHLSILVLYSFFILLYSFVIVQVTWCSQNGCIYCAGDLSNQLELFLAKNGLGQ
jgi:hypothetical protein